LNQRVNANHQPTRHRRKQQGAATMTKTKTFTRDQAIAFALQRNCPLIGKRQWRCRVRIEQDWLPNGQMFMKFRALRGHYAGEIIDCAYPLC
jgi:hypothetical protein